MTHKAKENQKQTPTAEELEAALSGAEAAGEQPQTEQIAEPVVAEPTAEAEAVKVDAEAENRARLDLLLGHIKPEHKAKVEKYPQDLDVQLELAEAFFKLDCPAGLGEVFKEKVKIDISPLIWKLAADHMVVLEGQTVAIAFPTGTEATVAVIDPTQKTAKGKGNGFQNQWGDCTLTLADGEVVDTMETDKGVKPLSASGMAKNLGLRITGHTNMLHVFKSPQQETEKDWGNKWTAKQITVVSGDESNKSAGIHVKLS